MDFYTICWYLLFCQVGYIITQDIQVISTTQSTTDRVENVGNYYTWTLMSDEMHYREPSEFNNTMVSAVSNSHRTAMTLDLSFTFPFYGWHINNITIGSGGFISTASFLHQWLTASEFIAPLMANFNPSLNETSRVIYKDTGSSFHVWWENMLLDDDISAGTFSFMTTVLQNGTILFAYKEVPKNPSEISTSQHPVKVGLSDAYYVDTESGDGTNQKTIYEYSRLEIPFETIGSGVYVQINPITGLCQNHYNTEDCNSWARNGVCLYERSAWMLRHCACSCDTQPFVPTTTMSANSTMFNRTDSVRTRRPYTSTDGYRGCWNVHHSYSECEEWMERGDCLDEANRDWMLDHCYYSCTRCVRPTPPGAGSKMTHYSLHVTVLLVLVKSVQT